MLRHELRLAAAALALGLAACGDLTHQNPYDPGTPPALQAKATLAGAVTLEALEAGEPDLAGVLVSVPGTSLTASTDAEGRFAITGVDPGTWSVQATKAGYRSATVTGVTVTLDDGNGTVQVPGLELLVSRGDVMGRVALQLDLASGQLEDSAAGVGVSLSGRPGAAFTDVAGNYEFSGVPVGIYAITAAKTGFKEKSLQLVEVTEGRITVLAELVLPPDPGGVGGSVLVLGAADSAGVTVRARGATLSGTPTEVITISDAGGDWLISPIPAGTYNVTFEKADYAVASTSAVVAPAEITTLAGVTLQRDTGSLVGTATLQGGGDHAGIQVTLTPEPTAADPTPAAAAAAITDAAGSWRADLLPVGRYTVAYRKQPGYLDQAGLATVVSHQVTRAPDATLPAVPGAIQGRALLEGAGAAGHAGTLVRLENTTISTFTAADGAWVLSGVGAGAQVVLLERTGFDGQRVQAVVGPGETLSLFDVTLPVSRGALAGRFTLPGAAASAGVVVTASGAGGATTVTDADGQFSLTGLPVGTYALTARLDPDWQPVTVTGVTVAPGATADLPGSPVALVPVTTASIAGTVLAEGAAAAGTTVDLSGQDFRGVAVASTVTSGAGGAWSFTGLAAGTYQVAFSRAGFESPAPLGVALGAGQGHATGATTLARSRGAIAGRFSLAGAAASSGVVVTLQGTAFSTVTDEGGDFTLSGVPVGTYTVLATRPPEWVSGTVAGVVVERDLTTTLPGSPVTLVPVGTSSIAGTALVESGAAPGTTVSLGGQDFRGLAVATSTLTGAGGAWSFASLPAGSYQVTFTRAGFESPAPVGVALGTGQAFAAGTTTLALSRGALAGAFALTGAGSSAGVVVTLSGTTFSTVTDEGGAFTLPGVPVGTYTVLAARPPDWAAATVAGVAVARGVTTTMTGSPVALQPIATASVTGTTLLESGAAAGTTVGLTGQDFRGQPVTASATTGATGAWTLPGLPAGSYQVGFTRAGFESPAPMGVALGTGQAFAAGTTTLALSRGTLAGAFALSGAGSSAGVVVTLSGTAFSTVTDEGGAFTLSGVPVGSYTVLAAKPPDWAPATVAGVAVSRNAQATLAGSPVALQPARTASIAGTVLAEGGTATGTLVSLSGQDFRGVAVTGSFTTGATGAWSFGTLAAGSYQVAFSRAGFEAPASLGVALGTGQAFAAGTTTLALSRGTLAGTFSLTGAGSSAGVVVTLSGTTFSTVTDAAGAFSLSGVPVGTYTVLAAKPPDWASGAVAGVAVARDATTTLPGSPVGLAPVATASLSGTALAEGLADASGTTVTLSGVDFRGVAVDGTTATAAGGLWTFPALRAGSYQVAFGRTAFDSPTPAGVSVVTGQAASLGTVTLAASRGTAAGTVTATGAPSKAGTVVTVSGGPDTASTVTDANGAWRIDGLRVGSGYQATYSRPAYVSQASATFTVAAATSTPVAAATLALDVTGRIAGVARLERPAAGPFDGTTVSLTGFDVNGAAVTASTSTAADGSYQLGGLAEGTYGLSFTRARYDAQALGGLFAAAGAQVTAPSAVLAVARAVLAGSVSLDAGNVAGFQVGTDFSGVVVTLSGTDVPVPSVVTDASGAYRFVDVPVSLAGGAFTVAAGKPFFEGGTAPVLAVANATTAVTPIALPLSDGSLTGTVLLTDNFKGNGDNLDHAGTLVDVSGTAFNGVGWQAVALTGADGFWDSGPLPPGTYDLTPASSGRTCEPYKRTTVEPRFVNDQGGLRCFDALAPGAPALGEPVVPADAEAGYTRLLVTAVPVATQATDPTLPDPNLRGYEVTHGAAPDWTRAVLVEGEPATLPFTDLAPNARNLLWARAVDWLGNAGAATSAEVITDTLAPATPRMTTPRAIVDEISTAVTLFGSEGDANFSHYETCSSTVGPQATCAATSPPGCIFASATASLSLSLVPSQTTCLYARAHDRAGNVSPERLLAVVSDLVPPAPPTVAPLYDPTVFTVSADYVDFFLTAASTDQPAGQGDWDKVAWVEADTGAGFEPLCPAAACRPGGVYAPCDPACACTDARLLCRGAEFAGVRMPLLGGTANRFSIRAVDVAGNVGSGATQQVNTVSTSQLVSSTFYDEAVPRTRHGLLTLTGNPVAVVGAFTGRLVVLGENKRYDATDASCDLDTPYNSATYRSHEPITTTSVVHVGGFGQTLKVRRAGVDRAFCTGDDATTVVRDVGAHPQNILSAAGSLDPAGTRERVAWAEGNVFTNAYTVKVREPGANGLIDLAGDDVDVTVASFTGGHPSEVLLGGNVLLYRQSNVGYTVVTAGTTSSGSFATSTRTAWALPAGAISAALDSSGVLLAWVANDPAQTIHLLTAGLDGIFGTADDVERTRTYGGGFLAGAGMAVEGGHVVVTETAASGSTYYVNHWYAGGDGRYGTGDDMGSRLLPSSRPRHYPALAGGIAAGTAYVQVGGTNTGGENADLLSFDLSATRWEVASDLSLTGPRSNGEGTLFFRDGLGRLAARSADGRERRSPYFAGAYAADGGAAYVVDGGTLLRSSPDADGLWFSGAGPADTVIFSGVASGAIEANDGYVVAETTAPAVGSLSLLRNVAGTWTPTRLDNTVAGTQALPIFGLGVSSAHVAWGCRDAGSIDRACVRSAGADGTLGNADDVTVILNRPGTVTQYYAVRSVRVSGNRVLVMGFVLGEGKNRLFVADAGADRRFNTADDAETDLGVVTETGNGFYDLRGAMVAWATITSGFPGTQLFVHDLRDGTRRQLTSHYSFKPDVRVEPSGRVYWLDTLLSAQAIFVSAP